MTFALFVCGVIGYVLSKYFKQQLPPPFGEAAKKVCDEGKNRKIDFDTEAVAEQASHAQQAEASLCLLVRQKSTQKLNAETRKRNRRQALTVPSIETSSPKVSLAVVTLAVAAEFLEQKDAVVDIVASEQEERVEPKACVVRPLASHVSVCTRAPESDDSELAEAEPSTNECQHTELLKEDGITDDSWTATFPELQASCHSVEEDLQACTESPAAVAGSPTAFVEIEVAQSYTDGQKVYEPIVSEDGRQFWTDGKQTYMLAAVPFDHLPIIQEAYAEDWLATPPPSPRACYTSFVPQDHCASFGSYYQVDCQVDYQAEDDAWDVCWDELVEVY